MNHDIFRDFINRHEWTFAKTYAAFCPHEYLVMKKLPGEEWPLFPEIARFIREKGFVAEYGRLGPNRYYGTIGTVLFVPKTGDGSVNGGKDPK